MRPMPERLTADWIDSLADSDLIDAEARGRARFQLLERREKKVRGNKYDLCRAPADLLEAWDRWSRLLSATRERSLRPRVIE
jgi:hypothetical protein